MSATIEVKNLTKRFGSFVAVEDVTFSVYPGRVTGFLGPNGAGKSTTLRCLTGLITETSGEALITSVPYRELPSPLSIVGTALETTGFHPGRSGFDNVWTMAVAAGFEKSSVERALKQVGMFDFAEKRVETYSLGMKQRLSLASALLGNPDILILDEPANGLDPEGIAWLRGFLRHHADEGGTVLLSSHVLSEVQQTVDDVIIISRGRLKKQCALSKLIKSTSNVVTVASPDTEKLVALFNEDAQFKLIVATRVNSHLLHFHGVTAKQIGAFAFRHNIEIHELSESRTDLEEVFLSLTGSDS